MRPEEYFEKMLPYAEKASAGTGIPVSVILAQWSWETDFGTNKGAREWNNHGGIKYVGASTQDYKAGQGVYAGYNSLDNFVKDYIRVMNLSYYKKVREAKGIKNIVTELGKSPYAESGYREIGGVPGGSILNRIKEYNLERFDNGTVKSNEYVRVPVPKGAEDKIVAIILIFVGFLMLLGITTSLLIPAKPEYEEG